MVEQIPLSCKNCNKVFNEDLEEARKYSKNNPFLCHQCLSIIESGNKLVDSELPINSRSNESNTLNDAAIIDAQQSRSSDSYIEPIIANPKNNQPYGLESSTSTPEIHHPNTIEHYESIATGEVKQVLDHMKIRRQRADQELQEERERTARYAGYQERGGGISIMPVVIGIIITGMLIGVFAIGIPTMISNSTPYPEINSTKDNITVQQCKTECNTVEGQMTIIPVIAILIIIIIMIMLVRILL